MYTHTAQRIFQAMLQVGKTLQSHTDFRLGHVKDNIVLLHPLTCLSLYQSVVMSLSLLLFLLLNVLLSLSVCCNVSLSLTLSVVKNKHSATQRASHTG